MVRPLLTNRASSKPVKCLRGFMAIPPRAQPDGSIKRMDGWTGTPSRTKPMLGRADGTVTIGATTTLSATVSYGTPGRFAVTMHISLPT